MSESQKVIQGQSFTVTLALSPEQDLDGWSCTIQVKDRCGEVLFTRAVTTKSQDNISFVEFINETDSGLLKVGPATIGYEIRNPATGENSPGTIKLFVSEDPIA